MLWALVYTAPIASAQVSAPIPASARTDRILVKPKPNADLAALHLALGTRVLRSFPGIGDWQVVQVPPTVGVAAALTVFRQSPLVQSAELDYLLTGLLTPNDFRYWDGSLWNLNNTGIYGGVVGADIDAPDGWNIQYTATNLVVAVIDSGARYTHEDLTANLWVAPGATNYGINAITGTDDPWDDFGHGTHVSGTIGGVGNNSVGIVGVAWQARLMECKFLDSTGQGTISDAITCIEYAQTNGARIINASWGGYTFTSAALYDAIAGARAAGMIFVAACGNNGNNNDVNPLFPASYDLDNIIAVAATDRTDTIATFSNYGPTTVDLGAPGSPIFSCWNGSDSDYQYLDGTSMAAANVSGVCAVVWAHYPNDAYRQIIRRVLSNTDPLPSLAGKCVTGGRLNLFKALAWQPGVTAGFVASPTSGLVPLAVSFTDTSSGLVTNWAWNFGDGTPNGTQQNPSHTYNQAGTFTATLTVTDDNGVTSSTNQPITVTGWMVVTPATGLSASGQQGGPFSPATQTYTITNQGSAPLNWSAGANQSWVTLSATSGTLAVGQQTSVTATINSQADWLSAGSYTATVSFNNLNNGDGNTTRPVSLTVNPNPVGILTVSPPSGFTATGPHGGPFTPGSQLYTLGNSGGASLSWTVTKNKNWISVSPGSGTLLPAASTSVKVSINTNANTLKPGTYYATMYFNNTTTGQGNTSVVITLKVSK